MNKLVLIDSSAWVETIREKNVPETAAKNSRACLRAGINVPFGDILVDACARRYGAGLLERDKHFGMIADALGK